MKVFVNKFLAAYDWHSFEEFVLSIFPSYKYQLHGAVLAISFLSGSVNYLFGVTPALAIAMFMAIVIEVWTGIRASKRQGKSFESFRFSRCIIKIAIWLAILYIIHAFKREFQESTNLIDIAAYGFFSFIFVCVSDCFFWLSMLLLFLENVSVLKGKEKTALIEAIQGGWQNLIYNIKPKKNEN